MEEMATSAEEGVKSEKILALKRSRSGVVGNLTRTYKDVESLMLSYENKDAAVKKKEDLDDRFENFKRLNENLLELLDDPEDQEEARNYFENQNKGKIEFNKHFEGWIKAAEGIPPEPRPGILEEENSETRSRSSRGSRSSRSSSSSYRRMKEAQAKQAVAKLKAIQLKVAQELEREELELKQKRHSIELQNELEQAALETRIWEQTDKLISGVHDHSPSRIQLNPEAPAWQPGIAKQENKTIRGHEPNERNILEMILQQQQYNEKLVTTIKQGFVLPKAETYFHGFGLCVIAYCGRIILG